MPLLRRLPPQCPPAAQPALPHAPSPPHRAPASPPASPLSAPEFTLHARCQACPHLVSIVRIARRSLSRTLTLSGIHLLTYFPRFPWHWHSRGIRKDLETQWRQPRHTSTPLLKCTLPLRAGVTITTFSPEWRC